MLDKTLEFIDAIIRKDYKTAAAITLDMEQGEQISMFKEEEDG